MKKSAGILLHLILALFSVVLIFGANSFLSGHINAGTIIDKEIELDSMVYAKVISIDNENKSDSEHIEINFTAQIFSDETNRSKTIHAKQQIICDGTRSVYTPVAVGDKVALLRRGVFFSVLLSTGQNYYTLYPLFRTHDCLWRNKGV